VLFFCFLPQPPPHKTYPSCHPFYYCADVRNQLFSCHQPIAFCTLHQIYILFPMCCLLLIQRVVTASQVQCNPLSKKTSKRQI